MSPERLRSIVPMFGGGTSYVETLDAILEFVDEHQPTTDELVGWHRGTFARVSSRDSILRRVDYLEDVGFIRRAGDYWQLGPEGEAYLSDQTTSTLLEIMVRRNVGLRSLLYALSAGPMTIDEVSHQQLDTHPELGWNPSSPDMAKQRTNWLRSLGLVEKDGSLYSLTDEGRKFTDRAVEQWAGTEEASVSNAGDGLTAATYETTVVARSVDPEFRATVLSQHDGMCPVSHVDHPALLDVAHVLPWSEYPDHRADLGNVLPLSKTHHAAFDRELFTIDADYRLRVNPEFDTQSDILQRTIIEQAGEQVSFGDTGPEPTYLQEHNQRLAWLAD
ncbi:HNH endonuclease [Haloglomus halophilum]|uniref:HNH endonuclease n=1 Tax=Haloglomus halophilum TaxID=2962672 RepID=UPI0020C96753|nr:HNH endonuclease [Haloglomus halophilum]